MRRGIVLMAVTGLVAAAALPAMAKDDDRGKRGSDRGEKRGWDDRGGGWGHGRNQCGRTDRQGYEVIFDGSRRCYREWRYAGGSEITLQRDGTLRAAPNDEPNLGVLWYAERPYADFSLKLEFRDDSPAGGPRANSGVQVRFPPPKPPVPGCPTTFNGSPQGENPEAWVAVNCGHEIQINDNVDGDPRKTGSVYGFADLDIEQARPVERGEWSEMEIRVVGQTYTVIRDGVVINEYENLPDVEFPGRPNDPNSSSRGLVGYIGLQAHGAPQDIVSFRDIRIKDLTDQD